MTKAIVNILVLTVTLSSAILPAMSEEMGDAEKNERWAASGAWQDVDLYSQQQQVTYQPQVLPAQQFRNGLPPTTTANLTPQTRRVIREVFVADLSPMPSSSTYIDYYTVDQSNITDRYPIRRPIDNDNGMTQPQSQSEFPNNY